MKPAQIKQAKAFFRQNPDGEICYHHRQGVTFYNAWQFERQCRQWLFERINRNEPKRGRADCPLFRAQLRNLRDMVAQGVIIRPGHINPLKGKAPRAYAALKNHLHF